MNTAEVQAVLEAEPKILHLGTDTRSAVSIGTMGNSGVDLCRLGLAGHRHVFSSQRQDLQKCLPGRPKAETEAPGPDRLPKHFLATHPVDYLMIDMLNTSVWERLLEEPEFTQLPKIIVVVGESKDLESETGLMDKLLRKRMEVRGYSEQHFWFLCAENYGGAINQERLVAVWGKPGCKLKRPEEFHLPGRNMENLLQPTGIPSGAWVRKPTTVCHDTRQWLPCEVRSTIRGEPVYEIGGIMPDRAKALIQAERGIRRLQTGELAKGKGVAGDWIVKGGNSKPIPSNSLKTTTCLHLWTAILDVVMEEPDPEESEPALETPPSQAGQDPMEAEADTAPETTEDDYTWEWHVPDLSEGSDWYNERVASLTVAVEGLEDAATIYAEGLLALKVHCGNYTAEGPKYLQLLWWEFPVEHWEDLRLGSSMNFLVTPSGELELNSLTDELDIQVAGQFVDQLMDLGVLLLAEGPLLANCPLFCVDKALQPGEKGCITDCKRGGTEPLHGARSGLPNPER